jgi:methionyl-tRNA synthetase
MSKFFLTTPIYYINDKPHIGHAYSTIAADVLARFHRQHGDEVFLSVGVDENSQKTAQAAGSDVPASIQAYADTMSRRWEDTWQALGISSDIFIRTTEPEHKRAVEAFFKAVKADDIYKGKYEGWYCVGCEAFKKEDDLVGGKCPDHQTTPQRLEEENYFFRLSRYQEPLLDHIKRNKSFIRPQSRRNEVVAFIERGLEDFSISRATQKWGIPFPGDDSQVVYVWFDALINYLTATGYPESDSRKVWPPNLHLVGKDIIKFHCIYWPAMLLSAGLTLPEMVFAHGFFTIDGTKISKSLGNAIDPVELVGLYGNDALRYYLLSEFPFGSDGDFSHERFRAVYDSDLANDLGNLVQRTAAMATKYLKGEIGIVPAHSHDVSNLNAAMANLRFDKALEDIWQRIRGLNQLIEEEKPWVLAKEDNNEHLKEVLQHLVADLLQIAQLLLPFMPATSAKIMNIFGGPTIKLDDGVLFPKDLPAAPAAKGFKVSDV